MLVSTRRNNRIIRILWLVQYFRN